MIITARQVEQLFKSNGKVTLPIGARLTPLASDWIKEHRVQVEYAGAAARIAEASQPQRPQAPNPIQSTESKASNGAWLWWSDGPCGAAKAALLTVAREVNAHAVEIPIGNREIVGAIKHLAGEVKAGRADGGILLVGSAASSMIYANRCPLLRAVLGTCIESVEQGVQLAAANVLIIEHPYKTVQQVKTLIGRFLRSGKRKLSEDVKRELSELNSCG